MSTSRAVPAVRSRRQRRAASDARRVQVSGLRAVAGARAHGKEHRPCPDVAHMPRGRRAVGSAKTHLTNKPLKHTIRWSDDWHLSVTAREPSAMTRRASSAVTPQGQKPGRVQPRARHMLWARRTLGRRPKKALVGARPAQRHAGEHPVMPWPEHQ